MKKSNGLLAFALVMFALHGCGGSSGGGSDDVGGLTYVGRTDPATVSDANANDLTENVIGVYGVVGNDNLGLRPAAADVSSNSRLAGHGFAAIDKIRTRLVDGPVVTSANSVLASRTNVDVDLSDECDSGIWRIVGYVEESNNTAEISSLFDGCVIDGDRIDGELGFVILDLNFDPNVTSIFGLDIILSFENLRISGADGNISIGGDTRYTVDTFANAENETVIDLIIRDNNTGDMLRIVNLVSVYSFDDVEFPTRVTIDIVSGRIFDSRHGYVDVASPLVIDFNSISQDFPDAGLWQMSANGVIVVTVIDRFQARIQVDTNNNLGDGYEVDRIIDWSDL